MVEKREGIGWRRLAGGSGGVLVIDLPFVM
jgi:hypothetical protein